MKFNKKFKIGNVCVGEGCPCFIIAEAGVNHNKDVSLAKKLVDAAIYAGADAVKFQTWLTEELMVKDLSTAEYHEKSTGFENFFELAKSIELKYEDFMEIKEYCDKKGIIFLSTPDEEKSADFLQSLDVPAFKIGSPEFNNLRMIRHIIKKNKPTLISTGMNSEEDIEEVMQFIETLNNRNIGLFHCISEYPVSYDQVNLNFMKTLEKRYACVVGFSDHTAGTKVAGLAIAAGAKIYEAHLTLDKTMIGPDHAASLSPDEFKKLVDDIRLAEKVMGSHRKIITEIEVQNASKMKKVIVASRRIKKGELLKSEDIVMKRANHGLSPKNEDSVIGKVVNKDLDKDEIISMDVLD